MVAVLIVPLSRNNPQVTQDNPQIFVGMTCRYVPYPCSEGSIFSQMRFELTELTKLADVRAQPKKTL